jgi:hypothetical protein
VAEKGAVHGRSGHVPSEDLALNGAASVGSSGAGVPGLWWVAIVLWRFRFGTGVGGHERCEATENEPGREAHTGLLTGGNLRLKMTG